MAGRSEPKGRRRSAPSVDLAELGHTFARLRRRHARQGRRVRQLAAQANDLATSRRIDPIGRQKGNNAALERTRQEVGYHTTWARWSSTYDELATLADRIGRHPASSIADLATKFEVLVWLLLVDDAVIDRVAARHVRLFGREMTQLATPRRSARK